MNTILVIGIACVLAAVLAYHLGVRQGRRESRQGEYLRGFRTGYDQAGKEHSELFGLEDEDLLFRIRNLRDTAGK